MSREKLLQDLKELVKHAKENPKEFEEALKKAQPAPAPMVAPKPAAAQPKPAMPKPAAPKMMAPKSAPQAKPAMAMGKDELSTDKEAQGGKMSKEERSALVKEALKEDYKPRFQKCGEMQQAKKAEIKPDPKAQGGQVSNKEGK